MITDRRMEKFRKVAARRQHMTVVLENVHDPHNIGAILRSCDSVGVQEIYVLYTDERLKAKKHGEMKFSSTGVRKWLHIHYFEDVAACFEKIKSEYDKVYATHLDEESHSLYECDLTGNLAFIFGNEHDGISREALRFADGNILIPQFGMVQSLNISVACAVILHEASRQRQTRGMYRNEINEGDTKRQSYLDHFINKHK